MTRCRDAAADGARPRLAVRGLDDRHRRVAHRRTARRRARLGARRIRDVMRGGVVAYATDVKHSLLGSTPTCSPRRGAVDPAVARQMAEGVRGLPSTGGPPTSASSTTGVAGPDPQDGQPVGTVHIAVVDARRHRHHVARAPRRSREQIRARPSAAALALRLERTRESPTAGTDRVSARLHSAIPTHSPARRD